MSTNNLDNLYRQVIMDHYRSPRNKGVLSDSTLTVDMNNPTCGDVVHLTMNVEEGKITDAKFEGDGCSISMASASMMTQLIIGKEVDTALYMSVAFSEILQGKDYDGEEDLGDLEALQGVAKFPARIKCATLGWMAMEKGLKKE